MKVKDFLNKWSGDILLLDTNGSVYTDFRENVDDILFGKEVLSAQLGFQYNRFYDNTMVIIV